MEYIIILLSPLFQVILQLFCLMPFKYIFQLHNYDRYNERLLMYEQIKVFFFKLNCSSN